MPTCTPGDRIHKLTPRTKLRGVFLKYWRLAGVPIVYAYTGVHVVLCSSKNKHATKHFLRLSTRWSSHWSRVKMDVVLHRRSRHGEVEMPENRRTSDPMFPKLDDARELRAWRP